MTIQQAIKRRIDELLYQYDIKLSKVAFNAGVTASTFYSLSARKNSNPKIKTIKTFCDGLGIKLRDFFATDYFDSLPVEKD